MSDKTSNSAAAQEDQVTLEIDGRSVTVPKGTVVIRAAEKLGIAIPRFCDHPLLDPVGACRQCMVEVPDAGNGRGFPKPQSSCTLVAADGMVVKTQNSSMLADEAQKGIMELLLINHPLDCPNCDKGGECPLQNQAMTRGRGATRFDVEKRKYHPKPLDLVGNILLDRERCVLCTRCTRFSEQVSGDRCIALAERGARQQVCSVEESEAGSYFTGNTVQICPVGALTSADYRFQARPFDLVSTETTCEHCAAGCKLRIDHRHGTITRRLAGEDAAVNQEWNCDKGRFGFRYGTLSDRITTPLIRKDGELVPASWPEALTVAAAGLASADGNVGILPGANNTVENTYAYSAFARNVVKSDHIDFRSDKGTAEEAAFLAQYVAGTSLDDSVTYQDLENAKKVVLVSLDAEDEAPILFLRLRRAVRKFGLEVVNIASHQSIGADKLDATWVGCRPGAEAEALSELEDLDNDTIILVGARAASAPGTYSAVVKVAEANNARFAWVPLHSGDRGAIEAGCLPGADGKATKGMLEAATAGDIKALLVGDLEEGDYDDPGLLYAAVDKAFTVQLATRRTDVSNRAEVVFPVSLITEVSGHFLNWESRWRPVNPLDGVKVATMSDRRVLGALAQEMASSLDIPASAEVAEVLQSAATGPIGGHMPTINNTATNGDLIVDTWPELMGDSPALDGTMYKGNDKRRGKLRVNASTAEKYGLTASAAATVSTPQGAVTLPVQIVDAMVDDVVWVPSNAPGQPLAPTGAQIGDRVVIVATDDKLDTRMEVSSRG
ncbi:MAG: NADH-quinone oxidoreductase subunit G [Lawsonella sp.]